MDFESLKNNLQILDGSDRTSYLIDLAKKSHGIPTHEKNDENRICLLYTSDAADE